MVAKTLGLALLVGTGIVIHLSGCKDDWRPLDQEVAEADKLNGLEFKGK